MKGKRDSKEWFIEALETGHSKTILVISGSEFVPEDLYREEYEPASQARHSKPLSLLLTSDR